MQQITEAMIAALAPNPAAAANGRKISQKGNFVKLSRSSDDTFYLGECSGSGASNYTTSADFIDPAQPVFRCSCPSHQFPCKHSLGLLYEIVSAKPFDVCEIPADIAEKRAKKKARSEKAAASPGGMTGGDTAGATDGDSGVCAIDASDVPSAERPGSEPKVNKAARAKKLQKQLEGIDMTAKLVADLLRTGLGAMGGAELGTYRQLSKQLGDYYLPGPQRLLNRLILEIEAFQSDGADGHYDSAVAVLERLNALVKKSRQYLSEKLESGDVGQDDNLLYEELGGAWKLSELAALGLSKQDARFAQLSFWVELDEARSEYIDVGVWADLDTGEISLTQNYRPLKALKYVKQDDTVFGAARVPLACYYPGSGNRRVRWEGMELRELTAADLGQLRDKASELAPAVKEAKNLLKNTLSDPFYITLIRYSLIGTSCGQLALADTSGSTIALGIREGMDDTVSSLELLGDGTLLRDQVLAGAFFYDGVARRIALQPLSIITPDRIVRLLY